jgi:hypothetical protein
LSLRVSEKILVKDGRCGLTHQMPGLRAGPVKLRLQVVAGDEHVLHGHVRLEMSE